MFSKAAFILLIAILSIVFVIYSALPSQGFPKPYPGAKKSAEPADLETSIRQGYYIDGATREEIITFYQTQFSTTSTLGIPIPILRLNYPPEEAQTIIRDQTKSTFLEEIVNPFRESIYINGFEPKTADKFIYIEGKKWDKKIIIRYVHAPILSRVVIATVTAFLFWVVSYVWIKQISNDIKLLKK